VPSQVREYAQLRKIDPVSAAVTGVPAPQSQACCSLRAAEPYGQVMLRPPAALIGGGTGYDENAYWAQLWLRVQGKGVEDGLGATVRGQGHQGSVAGRSAESVVIRHRRHIQAETLRVENSPAVPRKVGCYSTMHFSIPAAKFQATLLFIAETRRLL